MSSADGLRVLGKGLPTASFGPSVVRDIASDESGRLITTDAAPGMAQRQFGVPAAAAIALFPASGAANLRTMLHTIIISNPNAGAITLTVRIVAGAVVIVATIAPTHTRQFTGPWDIGVNAASEVQLSGVPAAPVEVSARAYTETI